MTLFAIVIWVSLFLFLPNIKLNAWKLKPHCTYNIHVYCRNKAKLKEKRVASKWNKTEKYRSKCSIARFNDTFCTFEFHFVAAMYIVCGFNFQAFNSLKRRKGSRLCLFENLDRVTFAGKLLLNIIQKQLCKWAPFCAHYERECADL